MKKLLSLVTVAAIVSGALAFTKGPNTECVFVPSLGGCDIRSIIILGTQGNAYKEDWDGTDEDCQLNDRCFDPIQFEFN